MGIAFIDLKTQYQKNEQNINNAVLEVLQHGKYIMGPEVQALEQQLADFAGVKHVVACASGTDALLVPLMAAGIGPGDAVFTTPFTFFATAEVIALLGATPVFVDIDPDTYNIDPVKLEEAIIKVKQTGELKLKSIIPVDLFGLCADYDAILPIAEKYNMWILEDAAQALGAIYNNRRAPNLGLVGATSFFPAKPLGCYGDGGAIFTDDDELALKYRSIIVHGKGSDKYNNIRIGLNSRIDTIQAAILLEKLKLFPEELKLRQQVAEEYSRQLTDFVKVPFIPETQQSAWAQYCIQSEHRTVIQQALKDNGIPSAIYYPLPLHLQDAFKELGYKQGDMPVAEAVSQKIFALPMHPYLTDDMICSISDIIIAAVG